MRISPFFLDEAAAGDAGASKIVRDHGRAMGEYARVAARKVGVEGTSFPLVLAGGVFRHASTLLPDAIIERVRTTSPGVRPVRSRFEPVIGALFTALEVAGTAIDDALLDRLVPTIPSPELFATTLEYRMK